MLLLVQVQGKIILLLAPNISSQGKWVWRAEHH